jgi:hypothetical protein
MGLVVPGGQLSAVRAGPAVVCVRVIDLLLAERFTDFLILGAGFPAVEGQCRSCPPVPLC